MIVRVEARQDWRERARCIGEDAELFFPAGDSGPAYDRQVARARAVCAGCPVRTACLAWAMEALPYGVAGGLTEDERRRSRRSTTRRRQRVAVRAVEQQSARRRSDRAPVIAEGRAALAVGVAREEVALTLGVTRRTVERWAATAPVALVGGGR